jgi:hypothetical protein
LSASVASSYKNEHPAQILLIYNAQYFNLYLNIFCFRRLREANSFLLSGAKRPAAVDTPQNLGGVAISNINK